jgi:RsiW-degrading membrane proteinase PrsW (M82 family)
VKVIGFEVLAEPSIGAQIPEFIDIATLAGGISVFVPLVVAFITKRQASDRVKAVTNLLAVAVASVVALFVNGNAGGPVTWQVIAATFMIGLVSSIVAYKAGWKPVGLAPALANATSNFGIGTPVPSVVETTRPATGVQE